MTEEKSDQQGEKEDTRSGPEVVPVDFQSDCPFLSLLGFRCLGHIRLNKSHSHVSGGSRILKNGVGVADDEGWSNFFLTSKIMLRGVDEKQ